MESKNIRMVVSLSDVEDFNYDDKASVEYRLRNRCSFGNIFRNSEITVYPRIIAHIFKEEDKIIRKLNYTVTHELIHGLLEDSIFDTNDEDLCHGLTMILTEDTESNRSLKGMTSFNRYKNKIEITIDDTEEEPETEEAQFEAQTRKAILTEAEIVNANRNLSRERLRKFHETIS